MIAWSLAGFERGLQSCQCLSQSCRILSDSANQILPEKYRLRPNAYLCDPECDNFPEKNRSISDVILLELDDTDDSKKTDFTLRNRLMNVLRADTTKIAVV